MQETTLHAELKEIYRLEGGQVETWVDGYLIDVVKPNLLIEIQTRNLGALKKKLDDLLDNHPVQSGPSHCEGEIYCPDRYRWKSDLSTPLAEERKD